MIRSTLVYRRLWYTKRRNAKMLHVYSRIISAIIIFMLMISYAQKNIISYIADYYETDMRNKVETLVIDLISTRFADELEYDNITNIIRNKQGNIISIETKNAVLNPISSDISAIINEEIEISDIKKLNLSLGNLVGSPILKDIGPCLSVNVHRYGNTKANFREDFIRDGKGYARHRIFIQVITTIGIDAPFAWKKYRLIAEVPIADAVITDDNYLR